MSCIIIAFLPQEADLAFFNRRTLFVVAIEFVKGPLFMRMSEQIIIL